MAWTAAGDAGAGLQGRRRNRGLSGLGLLGLLWCLATIPAVAGSGAATGPGAEPNRGPGGGFADDPGLPLQRDWSALAPVVSERWLAGVTTGSMPDPPPADADRDPVAVEGSARVGTAAGGRAEFPDALPELPPAPPLPEVLAGSGAPGAASVASGPGTAGPGDGLPPIATAPLRLAAVLDLARQRNLDLAQQRIRITSGRLDERQADNAAIPNLNLSVSDSHTHHQDRAQRADLGFANRSTLVSLALVQSWPVLGHAIDLERKLTRLRTLAREVTLRRLELALARTVVRTWLGLVRERELSRIHRQNLGLLAMLKDVALLNLQVGLAVKNDLLRIEVQQAMTETDLLKAENEVENRRVELTGLLDLHAVGLPALAMPPGLAFATASGVELAARGEPLMLARDPDLELAQTDLTIARETVAATRFAKLPTLSVGAQLDYAPQRGRQHDARDLSVQIALTTPVYNGGDTRMEVEKMRHALTLAELAVQALTNQKRTAWRKAVADHQEVVARLRSTDKAVEQARENMRMVMVRYQHGDASVIEVVDAQITLTSAQQRAIEAAHDERVRYAELLLLTADTERLATLDAGGRS